MDTDSEQPKPINTIPVNIEDQMREAYLEYAMSVIVGRALPDARDGLKPVHRRILYAMFAMGNTSDKAYKKSARIVGDVIGKYHPHGDSAVYETMVRMAQDFSLRYPLVEGQGNFGSVDGDPPAAMRYTEVRLEKISNLVLADIEKETVNFVPNYDNSMQEPVVLPTRLPNLLVNGATGIAVGMATNIPPHNLCEVVKGVKQLIHDPAVTLDELIKTIPGPDFPTAGYIYGRKGLRDAYTTGKGVIQLRAKAEIEEIPKKNKERIIVTEIPFQVNKAKLIEHVAELVREKKIDGLSDLRDESDRNGMRIVFELKQGEDSRIILNQLYKNTQMQVSFGISMLALDNQQPKLLNIKELLNSFLSFRKEVVTRRTAFELRKAEEKAHILEALKKAVENLDDVVALIRKAKNPPEAQAQLIAKYQFSEIQAKAILEMRLQRLTGLERDKIVKDYKETLALIKELKSILADEKKVLAIIEKELDELVKEYGDERRTQFIEQQEELTAEDLIMDEDMVVTTTYGGYIKRLPVTTYRAQRRGGKGVFGTNSSGNKTGGIIRELFVASMHDYILCFTNLGRVYWIKVHQIPEGNRTAKGRPIVSLLNLAKDEKIQATLPIREFREDEYIVMASRQGLVKKTSVMAYSRPLRRGLIALTIVPGDELVDARIARDTDDLVLVSGGGRCIRFESALVRPMGRGAKGVAGMRLGKEDSVIGMSVVDQKSTEAQILTVTENGFGKRTPVEAYRKIGRGGMGVIAMRVNERNGPIVAVRHVENQDDIIVASDSGKLIRTNVADIRETGRAAQGVRLISLHSGEKVGAVAKIVERDDE